MKKSIKIMWFFPLTQFSKSFAEIFPKFNLKLYSIFSQLLLVFGKFSSVNHLRMVVVKIGSRLHEDELKGKVFLDLKVFLPKLCSSFPDFSQVL